MNIDSSSPNDFFDEDYFLNGPSTGKSNYENYSWKPELTIPMAATMKRLLGMRDKSRVLDFGCSRGYLVAALRILEIESYGYDFSKWAIQHCFPDVKDYLSNALTAEPMQYDYVIAKDVLEHLSEAQLNEVLPSLYEATIKSLFFIVPLTERDGSSYICPRDEQDPTHIIRWTLPTWIKFFQSIDRRMVVTGSYFVPGIKEANVAWENSCGFFHVRRF